MLQPACILAPSTAAPSDFALEGFWQHGSNTQTGTQRGPHNAQGRPDSEQTACRTATEIAQGPDAVSNKPRRTPQSPA